MKIITYTNLVMLFLLQFINQILIPIPIYILAMFYVVAFLLSDKKNILGIFLFLIMVSSGSLLYLTNILFVIFLIIRYRDIISINIYAFFILVLSLYEGIHVFINSIGGFQDEILKLLGFTICLIPFAFLPQLRQEIAIKTTYKYLVIGFVLFTFITIGTYVFHYNIFSYFTVIRRFGFLPNFENEAALLINPNTIGRYSAFIISLFLLLVNFKYLKVNFLNLISIIYITIIGTLTLSRGFLLTLVLIFLLYLLSNLLRGKIAHVFGLTSLILISIFILNKFFNTLTSSIYRRVFESDDISGSRFYLYEAYFKILISNWDILLVGVGMQDYLSKVQEINPFITQATHNIVLETFMIWGFLGACLILLFIITLLYKSIHFNKQNIQNKIIMMLPLFAILISTMFGQFFISYYHTFSITLFALLVLNIKEGKVDV